MAKWTAIKAISPAMPLKTLFLFSKQVAAAIAPQISRTPDKTNDHRKFSVSGISKGKFRSLSKTRKLPRIEKPALKIHKTEAAQLCGGNRKFPCRWSCVFRIVRQIKRNQAHNCRSANKHHVYHWKKGVDFCFLVIRLRFFVKSGENSFKQQ